MKRITYWPQAWLGIAMNFGLIVAWVATTNEVNVQLLTLLMVGTWGWTMHYGLFLHLHDREGATDTAFRHHLRLPGSQR
jgi:4-hydroxybenzoate polyprenyltransferase